MAVITRLEERPGIVVAADQEAVFAKAHQWIAAHAHARSGASMTCGLIQLAPGNYDLLLGDVIVARVVRSSSHEPVIWTAELLKDTPSSHRPAPFTKAEHDLASFSELCAWLDTPDVKPNRRDQSRL
jgi:hypothetical protein